jgi:hypothetical protein
VVTFLALPSPETGTLSSRQMCSPLSLLPTPQQTLGASGPSWEMSRVQSLAYGLGCHKKLDWMMANVPPTLTAGVLYLGVHPTPFNEPHVSREQEAVPWPRPHPITPASAFLCDSFSLP